MTPTATTVSGCLTVESPLSTRRNRHVRSLARKVLREPGWQGRSEWASAGGVEDGSRYSERENHGGRVKHKTSVRITET